MKQLLYLCFLCSILSCTKTDNSPEPPIQVEEYVDERLSAAVSYRYSDEKVSTFLQHPTQAYITGYFRLPDNLPEDVIFGLDLEWFEGLNRPIFVPGGDWMAFAGFTQSGHLWVPHGTEPNREGIPTAAENFEVFDLDIAIEPNIWYKMQINCDYEKRTFVSVSLVGGDVDITHDLEEVWLEYPNYVAFDEPTLTAYCFASRSVNLAENKSGDAFVYFDDIEVGIQTETGFEIILTDSFENPNSLANAPYDFNAQTNPLSNVAENHWYSENSEAKLLFTKKNARTGQYAMECNATLVRDRP